VQWAEFGGAKIRNSEIWSGLTVFFKEWWVSQFFILRLCNKIMMAIRETRIKRETRCHVLYIVYRKFLTTTNYYKLYSVFIT